jgi:excisionase family DNA binding protein
MSATDIAAFGKRHGLSESTIYKEINEGRLRAFKVGRRTIITDDAAAEWRAALPQITPKRETVAA